MLSVCGISTLRTNGLSPHVPPVSYYIHLSHAESWSYCLDAYALSWWKERLVMMSIECVVEKTMSPRGEKLRGWSG